MLRKLFGMLTHSDQGGIIAKSMCVYCNDF